MMTSHFRIVLGETMRILLAGLLGGIAMYVWSTIAHVATPLGTTGISTLPDEQVTMNALEATLAEQHGLYLFPDLRLRPTDDSNVLASASACSLRSLSRCLSNS